MSYLFKDSKNRFKKDSKYRMRNENALAMDNVKKFYDKYPDGINKTSVSAYIMEASKGKKGDAISKISTAKLSKDLFPEDFKRV